MESNEQIEPTSETATKMEEEEMPACRWGKVGVERLSKTEKELMNMDNSEVIAGGGGHKGTKW